MSARILTLPARRRAPQAVSTRGIEVSEETGWTCVLLAPEVTVGQLMHALVGTDLVLSSDEISGVATLHRRPRTGDAA